MWRARYAQGIVLGLIALTLAASLLWAFSVVDHVFRTVATGEGERFLHAMRLLQRGGRPVGERDLASLIERHQAAGLRCVVLFDRGWRVESRAGDCGASPAAIESLARSLRPGELAERGGRAIMVHRPPPPPGPPRGPLAPPPPRDVLIEFVPTQALALQGAVTGSLAAGLLATIALLVATVVFWRLSTRSDRLQEQVERNRLLATLGEMSAVLAHEIRNPLASLKGHAQLLLERLPDGDATQERAARVVREAVRLERLCADLLSLVRADRLERVEVDPTALLREAVDAVGDRRIRVVTDAAPAHWNLDPERMHEVLGNLLRNAVHAVDAETPERQTVMASVGCQNRALVFAVRDTGSGVRPGDEERIFEAFRTTKIHGTGLGLAVARRIVEAHGGSITVRNHPEGGAEFRVVVPAPGKP